MLSHMNILLIIMILKLLFLNLHYIRSYIIIFKQLNFFSTLYSLLLNSQAYSVNIILFKYYNKLF